MRNINENLEILNTKNNDFLNVELEELYKHNEVKENNFKNILKVKTVFKNNIP